jgi:hypothetical protein
MLSNFQHTMAYEKSFLKQQHNYKKVEKSFSEMPFFPCHFIQNDKHHTPFQVFQIYLKQ